MVPFVEEIEVFRHEQQQAQQFFLGYLGIRDMAAKSRSTLRSMNETPTFWIVAEHSMLLSSFIVLGRIFDLDPKSDHNINRLMRCVENNRAIFTRAALTARKRDAGVSAADSESYVSDKHEMSAEDTREIRKQVAHWRRVYEKRFRDVRHTVFAHKARQEVAAAAIAKANIEGIKELLAFLEALYETLIEVYLNGRKPVVKPQAFTLPPKQHGTSAGERVYWQAQLVLQMITPPDPEEERYNAGDWRGP